jgi:ABC-type Fe3+/spermidine/putrescine transport system ATPase subunit
MDGLELKNIRKSFGATVAVNGVSLTIARGELFFLLGPSGCGKTTLLRMVAGFIQPDSGAIVYRGQDLTPTPIERRNIGMVFQSYSLWPHMSVFDNVAYGLRMRHASAGDIGKRVSAALEMVDMAALGNRKPAELSGGQQQRVALARALVYEPEILLLDEPLSNLDAKLRKEMRREIRSLHERLRITMVYVTHDQEEAATMADRIALLRGGSLVQLGTPQELYHRPASVFAAEFFGQANVIAGSVTSVADGVARVVSSQGIFEAHPAPAWVAPGKSVRMIIRPENLRINADAEPVNRLSATVVAREFSGSTESYTLAAGDLRLLALAVADGGRLLAPGDEVSVSVDPAAIHLVNDEGRS